MLSRFDLIFILLDKPDEHRDALLSEHVMSLHARPNSTRSHSRPGTGSSQRNQLDPVSTDSNVSYTHSLMYCWQGRAEWEKGKPLEDRLKLKPEEQQEFDAIPGPLLRKYIAYARKYCFPRLSSGAKQVLQVPVLVIFRAALGSEGKGLQPGPCLWCTQSSCSLQFGRRQRQNRFPGHPGPTLHATGDNISRKCNPSLRCEHLCGRGSNLFIFCCCFRMPSV